MTRVTEHQQAGLRRMIRDAMAIDPLISISGLQRALYKKLGREIDEVFMKKLVRKVTAEMVVVADREKVEQRISYLRERNRVICEELFRIAFPSETEMYRGDIKDRIKALQTISTIEARQIKLEMDLGLFTRQIGTLNINHRLKPMEADTLIQVSEVFRLWAEPPQMRKIEVREVKAIEVIPNSTINTNESNRPATTAITATIPVDTTARLVPVE